MIAVLAMLIALPSAPGCHSLGASVRCVLAAAVEVKPQPLARMSLPMPKRVPTKPVKHRDPAPRHIVPEGPPDAETIAKHIQSLVSIQDCTGARTYAASIGQPALGDQTFAACIGR